MYIRAKLFQRINALKIRELFDDHSLSLSLSLFLPLSLSLIGKSLMICLSLILFLSYRCCGLQAIKYCANSPLERIGAQVPAWLAPMNDKQSRLPARAGRIN
jgi:hypothetical protein